MSMDSTIPWHVPSMPEFGAACLLAAADRTDDDAEEERRSFLDDSFTQEQFQFSLDTMAPPQNSVCAVCSEPLLGLNIIRCWDCRMEGELLCPEHDASRHARAHLHRRDHFVDGYAAPLAPCDVLRINEDAPPRIESEWAHMHADLQAAASCAFLLSTRRYATFQPT